jgi:hypothetical protein
MALEYKPANPAWLKPGPSGPDLIPRLTYSLHQRVIRWAQPHLSWLNRIGARVTVRDLFGTPGDTLLTAMACRQLKERWPRLRLNCLTKNPDLLECDPHLDELNGAPGLFCFDFYYLETQQRRDRVTNVLAPFLASFGVSPPDYRARVYLRDEERAAAHTRLDRLPRPLIAVSTLSAQPVKNWPLDRWRQLAPALAQRGTLLHLGDAREPALPQAQSLAGTLSKRESLAVLAECAAFIGPESFLVHAANGLDVPSVVIFGGSRTPANLGYAANINLFTELPCSGCWLTGLPGSECPHDLACMTAIAPPTVLAAVDELLARKKSSEMKTSATSTHASL